MKSSSADTSAIDYEELVRALLEIIKELKEKNEELKTSLNNIVSGN